MTAGVDALPLPTGSSGGLTVAANTLTRVRDRVSQTRVYQVGGNAPYISETWQGAAARSRSDEADSLRTRISSAANRLPVIGSALRRYQESLEVATETIRALQRQWDEAEETYRAHLHRVNSEPEEDRQAVADSYADERDASHQRLRTRYAQAMSELREAGRAAAAVIKGQCDDVVPEARAGDRLEVGAHVLRDLALSGGQARSELADALAPEFVELLSSGLSSKDPEVFAGIVAQYERYAPDPYFAHAVLSRLKLGGLVDVAHELSMASVLDRGHEDLTGPQESLFGMLGQLYVAASGPAHGDIPADGYDYHSMTGWRATWWDDLVESGNSSVELHGTHYPGYGLQGQLLAAADARGTVPGAGYMGVVGRDMVVWDRTQGLADGGRDWTFALPDGDRPTLVADDGGAFAGLAADPLYALLHAASQDEEATRALLLSRIETDAPTHGDTAGRTVHGNTEDQTVIHYLVRERGGTMAYSQPFADHGALLADTVARYGVDRQDPDSAQLAAHYLHSYMHTLDAGAFSNGVSLPPEAFAHSRSGTAEVMVAHLDDLVRSNFTEDTIEDGRFVQPDGNGGHVLLFDDNAQFTRTLGYLALDRPGEIAFAVLEDNGSTAVVGDPSDPPAFQRLLNAAVARNRISLDAAYAQPSGDPLLVMDEGASFIVRITEDAGQRLLADAEAQDEYGEYLGRLANAGAGMVPVTGIPGVGRAGGTLYGLAADALLDRVIDTDHASDQRSVRADVRNNVRDLLQQQGRMAIIYAGAWEEGKDPVTWAAHNDLEEDENFVRDGELIPLDELLDPASTELSTARTAFLNRYLTRQDGAGGVMADMNRIARVATSAERDQAEDHSVGGMG